MSNIYTLNNAIKKQMNEFNINDALFHDQLNREEVDNYITKQLRTKNLSYVDDLIKLIYLTSEDKKLYCFNDTWFTIDKIFYLHTIALKYYEYLIKYYHDLVLELLTVDSVSVNNYPIEHQKYLKNAKIQSELFINKLKIQYEMLNKYDGDKHNKKYLILDNGTHVILNYND